MDGEKMVLRLLERNKDFDLKGYPLRDDAKEDLRGALQKRDGLIVVSDSTTGFWAFRMDGFLGWNGESWGMPDISSAQKWDSGPGGGR